MEDIDERKQAEEMAKMAQFEDSGPRQARAKSLSVDKSWALAHFSGVAQRVEPSREASRLPIAKIGLALVILASGIIYAEYRGAFHRAPAPPPVSIAPVAMVPAPNGAPFYVPPAPLASSRESLPEPAPVAPVEEAPAPDPGIADRIKHLEDGFNLMQRELGETLDKKAGFQWELTIRAKYHKFDPWSAAERIDDIQIFSRQNPVLPQWQRRQLDNTYQAASADYINSQQGLADCQSKEDSLRARMRKCAEEHDALVTGISQ